MKPSTMLQWLERAMLTLGVVLASWCAVVWIDQWRTNRLAVPAPGSQPPSDRPVTGGSPSTPASPPRQVAMPGSWVARLDAPTVRMSATVLEGSDDQTLRRGAGHIEDTAFPGEPGNVGIAGHRDSVFRAVRHLQVGAPLDVTTSDHIYHYRIVKTAVVNPDDVYVLDPTDHQTLTLVTCYPFAFIGHAPKRFIISADLVNQDATGGGARRVIP